jgi:predicted DNA-binding transcriptional regulator YafY
MQAKAEPGNVDVASNLTPKAAAQRSARVAQLLDATLHHRQVAMRYHSFSSNREKDYVIDPYRLVFAQGGLYVVAHVPEYRQMRTFAVERIRSLSVTEERFEPIEIAEDAFAHSLGVNQGTPERIEIAFEPRIARYVKERTWHPSQQSSEQPDGTLTLTLNVCNDWALRSWVLGFGPLARVVSPPALAAQILDEIESTRSRYVPQLDFELPPGE